MRSLAGVTLILGVSVLAGNCSKKKPVDFAPLATEFVNNSLSFSPVGASGQGLHKLGNDNFDVVLDDLSRNSIEKQRSFYSSFHMRLNDIDKTTLSPEDRADFDIVQGQIGLALFDLDIAQSWRHAPQQYVELIGTALFNPYVLNYAQEKERWGHIILRMEKIPEFLRTAEENLVNAPPVWIQVAKDENAGNIALIDKTLRAAVPAGNKPIYDTTANKAIDALKKFNDFLDQELPKRRREDKEPDWRLGAENYATKFKLNLATDRTPDQVLKDAETRLGEVRQKMLELSLPLHAAKHPDHKDHADLNGDERLNKIVRETLDDIAAQHSTPGSYFDDAKKDLEEARAFVRQKNILTLPQTDNLQVIPTPEFERGIYGVGGFNPAPTLEPKLGAFFWITPIPAEWPKARAESKLREYNFYNLKLLTIHEAMPGHYVQGEFANALEPKGRRVLRAIFGNGPYVEGWAQYVTQVMLDEGMLNSAPEFRLTLYKQELRVDANAIIDIRSQTNRMTDDQAMQMMENATFQEHEEAVAKLQRVKLSSTQLPTYFVGWRDWLRVREGYKNAKGSGFSLQGFHDAALKEGAVPLPVLNRLLTGKDL